MKKETTPKKNETFFLSVNVSRGSMGDSEFVFERAHPEGFVAASKTPLCRVRATIVPGEEYKLFDQDAPHAVLRVAFTDEHDESVLRFDARRQGEVVGARPTAYRMHPSVPGFLAAPVRFARPERSPIPVGGAFDRLLKVDLKELEVGHVESVPGLIQEIRGQFHRVRVFEDAMTGHRVEAAWVSMNAHQQAPEGLLMADEVPSGTAFVRCAELERLPGALWYVGAGSQYNLVVTREGDVFTAWSSGRNDAYQLGPDRDLRSATLVRAEVITATIAAKSSEGATLTFVRALRKSVFFGFDDGTVWAVGTDRNFVVLEGGDVVNQELSRTAPTELRAFARLTKTAGAVSHEIVDVRNCGAIGDALCVVRRHNVTFEEDRWGIGVNAGDPLGTGDVDAIYDDFVERVTLQQRMLEHVNPLRAASLDGVSIAVVERYRRHLEIRLEREWYTIDLSSIVDAPIRYAVQDDWDDTVLIGF